MRSLLIALVLAGCATPPQPAPDARVHGCWIARDGAETTTMRWLPEPGNPGALIGDLLVYTPGGIGSERYQLQLRETGWRLCSLMGDEPRPCWPVAQGHEGALEEGLAFIDAHRDRLRIALVGAEGERVVFDGRRDGCD